MIRLGILAFLVVAAASSFELTAHSAPVARVPSGSTSAPVLGESVLVAPVRGRVLVRSPGASQFTELPGPLLIPVGSELDTTEGEVELTSALPGGATQSGSFRDGRFRVLQQVDAGGLTELDLTGGDFATVCSDAGAGRREPLYVIGEGGASVRRLWGSAKGKFRTRGRYSSTTVRGTIWLTDDRCGGTLTQVNEGSVAVSDFARDEEIELEAGESYLARLSGWGTVISVAIDPTAPGTVYLAAWDGQRGAFLFKTANAGASWSALGERFPYFSILVVDPSAPGTVYAGANAGGRQGVFKSADGGFTWRPMRKGMRSWSYITALVIVPQAPKTLYAGHIEGLYKTVDGGRHWFSVDRGLGDKGVHVTGLALDPRTGETVYAGTEVGVFKTTDGGQSWTQVLVSEDGVGVLAVDPRRPDTVYAGAGGDLLKSVDGGGSWSAIASGVRLSGLAFDSRSSETIYAPNVWWWDEHSSGGVLKTTDGGATWNLVGLGDLSVNVVTVDPKSPDTVYAGTADRGLYKSVDGGVSWQAANAGLAITPVTALAVAPSDPRTIYAGTIARQAPVLTSRDSGRSWAPAGAGIEGQPDALAVDPRSPLVVYAGNRYGVFKTTDGGLSWNRTANSGGMFNLILVIDPKTPDTVYAGSFYGVAKTTDGGRRWKSASRGLGRDPDVDALAIDPRSPRTLYAAVDGNAFKSKDGGEHWAEVGDDPFGPVLETLAIDPRSPGTLYAGGRVGGCCRYERAVFRSTDGGGHWKAWCTGLPKGRWASILALVVDPSRRGTVYVGASDGVYKSTKPGGRCRQLAKGYAVPELAIDPRGTTLYAALSEGTSRGVLILRLP